MAAVTSSVSPHPRAFAAVFLTGALVFCIQLWNQITSFALAPLPYGYSQRLFSLSFLITPPRQLWSPRAG